MKRIIISCGSGIATSTMVAVAVKEILSSLGKDMEIIKCSIPEIPGYMEGAILIISTAQVPFDTGSAIVVSGVPFLTGMGKEDTIAKIKDILIKV
ncbi:MAG: PTS sugar transporter subunit IIB [Brevinema sp.]